MTGCLKMRKRMRVPRILAAAYVSTRQTNSKRDPAFTECRAILASFGAGRRGFQSVKMFASIFVHNRPVPRAILNASGSCADR
jgi:hypothetical protein